MDCLYVLHPNITLERSIKLQRSFSFRISGKMSLKVFYNLHNLRFQASVSLNRLQHFLKNEELDPENVTRTGNSGK